MFLLYPFSQPFPHSLHPPAPPACPSPARPLSRAANVKYERDNIKSKGFGFVTFFYADDAQTALRDPIKQIDGRLTQCFLAIDGQIAARPHNARTVKQAAQLGIEISPDVQPLITPSVAAVAPFALPSSSLNPSTSTLHQQHSNQQQQQQQHPHPHQLHQQQPGSTPDAMMMARLHHHQLPPPSRMFVPMTMHDFQQQQMQQQQHAQHHQQQLHEHRDMHLSQPPMMMAVPTPFLDHHLAAIGHPLSGFHFQAQQHQQQHQQHPHMFQHHQQFQQQHQQQQAQLHAFPPPAPFHGLNLHQNGLPRPTALHLAPPSASLAASRLHVNARAFVPNGSAMQAPIEAQPWSAFAPIAETLLSSTRSAGFSADLSSSNAAANANAHHQPGVQSSAASASPACGVIGVRAPFMCPNPMPLSMSHSNSSSSSSASASVAPPRSITPLFLSLQPSVFAMRDDDSTMQALQLTEQKSCAEPGTAPSTHHRIPAIGCHKASEHDELSAEEAHLSDEIGAEAEQAIAGLFASIHFDSSSTSVAAALTAAPPQNLHDEAPQAKSLFGGMDYAFPSSLRISSSTGSASLSPSPSVSPVPTTHSSPTAATLSPPASAMTATSNDSPSAASPPMLAIEQAYAYLSGKHQQQQQQQDLFQQQHSAPSNEVGGSSSMPNHTLLPLHSTQSMFAPIARPSAVKRLF